MRWGPVRVRGRTAHSYLLHMLIPHRILFKKGGGCSESFHDKKTGKHCARLCYYKPPKPTDFILASASSLFPMEQKSPRVSGG